MYFLKNTLFLCVCGLEAPGYQSFICLKQRERTQAFGGYLCIRRENKRTQISHNPVLPQREADSGHRGASYTRVGRRCAGVGR